MYGLMVAFEPTRVVPVARGFNDGLNFGNVTTENEEGGADGTKNVRKQECCHCGGDHLKSNHLWLVGKKKKDNKLGKDESGQ